LQQLFAKNNVRTRAQLVRVAIERYRDHLTPATPSRIECAFPASKARTSLRTHSQVGYCFAHPRASELPE
jgi:hypothetical protein